MAFMKYFLRVFTPTRNRRLNELIGFLLFVSAILLFLALISYSPHDPSLNTAASPLPSRPASNWIGLLGALISDLLLQYAGIAIFFVPLMIGLLAARWFKSREIMSAGAKAIGAMTLLVFFPALLALLPWTLRWRHAVPIEGLLGRIVGDVLLHYLNLVGAYIVCGAVIGAALYLCTAFSFVALHTWLETRFAFVFAAWQRVEDWRTARARKKSQKELEKRPAGKPEVAAQFVPARQIPPSPEKSGIERIAEEGTDVVPSDTPVPLDVEDAFTAEPSIGAR